MTAEESQVDAIMESLERRFEEIDRNAEQEKTALRRATMAKVIEQEKEILYNIHSRMQGIVITLAKNLEDKGVPTQDICPLICQELSDVIEPDFVRKVLPERYKPQWRSR